MATRVYFVYILQKYQCQTKRPRKHQIMARDTNLGHDAQNPGRGGQD